MTRAEKLLKARDELQGIIADAHIAGRRGVDLALSLRQSFAKVEQILNQLEETKPVNNGQPQRKDLSNEQPKRT